MWNIAVTGLLAGYYEPDDQGRRAPESLYGAVKMWSHLQRQGLAVARCTIERLMRANGWRGVVRVEKVRTTVADPAAVRAPDLVDRQFRVPAPNLLVVADFTYVRLTSGAFACTPFVIDAFAGLIADWLVQHEPAHAPPRPETTGRVRSRLLCQLLSAARWRQTTRCARNSGSFTESYLAHYGDVRSAATALQVHPNTLRYHIRRVEEIVGVDLQDASDRLLLELQLTLRRRKEDAAPR